MLGRSTFSGSNETETFVTELFEGKSGHADNYRVALENLDLPR